MTATNHTITGALIVASVSNPIIAVPLAIFAHFVLDALPHFGFKSHSSRLFTIVLSADMGLAASVLLGILLLQPSNWILLITGGVLCASPDLMWLPRWINELRGKENPDMGIIEKFHANIQWAEQQTWFGIVCEVVWLCASFSLLAQQLN